MGKSLSGTLMGVLIKRGAYTLDQPAPIPEWQATPGDPRAKIRIADILHMSSGLRIRAPQDPDFDESGPYADHFYLYTGSVDSFKYAATLQARASHENPILIRIETRSGHGASSLTKQLDTAADVYTFIMHNMGVTPHFTPGAGVADAR